MGSLSCPHYRPLERLNWAPVLGLPQEPGHFTGPTYKSSFNPASWAWGVGLPHYPCYRPLRRADWAFVLGWRQRLGCFIGLASSLGLASGPVRLFFKPYQLPPSPCVRCAWARAVSLLGSGVISTWLLRKGLISFVALFIVFHV